VKSPCVDLCGFDGRSGWCRGRGRSREEVRRWRILRPGEALRVLDALPRRLSKLQADAAAKSRAS